MDEIILHSWHDVAQRLKYPTGIWLEWSPKTVTPKSSTGDVLQWHHSCHCSTITLNSMHWWMYMLVTGSTRGIITQVFFFCFFFNMLIQQFSSQWERKCPLCNFLMTFSVHWDSAQPNVKLLGCQSAPSQSEAMVQEEMDWMTPPDQEQVELNSEALRQYC